jgi:hypothetical protein
MTHQIKLVIFLSVWISCKSNVIESDKPVVKNKQDTSIKHQMILDTSIHDKKILKTVNVESKYSNDIFYNLRKDKYKPDQRVILDNKSYVFRDNLQLVHYDTLIKGVIVSQNMETSPGVIFVKEKPKRSLSGHVNTFENNFYKIIFFDSTFNVFNEYLIDKNNPFQLNKDSISCEKCYEGETHTANNWDDNPNYNIAANIDHYWTREAGIGFNQKGYVVIKYAISPRTKNDEWIDDINTFIILDNKGKIKYQLDSLQTDVMHTDVSWCGRYLIIQHGGMVTAKGDYLRASRVSIYDLESKKEVYHINHGVAIPIFERNLYILSYTEPNSKIPDYLQTELFFNFDERIIFKMDFTNEQWRYITLNKDEIQTHTNFLNLFPCETITF